MHSDTCSAAQNDTVDFTPLLGGKQVKVQTTTKAVTPFAGLLSFFAWLRAVGLPAKIAELMPFAYRSPNAIAPAHLLLAFLTAVILGANRFAHSGWLRHDKALHTIMGIVRFPGEDAIRRFFHRFGQGDIERFWRPLWRWLLALWTQPARGFTLDLDSTIFAREGRQEGAAKGYNPRRPGRLSHHPLLAVLAEAPLVLHAWLRSGNTASGRGVVAFLQEALNLLPSEWRLRCVRADLLPAASRRSPLRGSLPAGCLAPLGCGFFENGLLTYLEEQELAYIVAARLTCQVKRGLRGITDWKPLEGPYDTGTFDAKLQGWKKSRRFVVVRERIREGKDAVGRKLLEVPGYTYRVWVTNCEAAAEQIWRDYNKRATVEQRIEELKNDVHADSFCTQAFYATEAAFLAAVFAFNLLSTYQGRVMPQEGYRQPATLRAAVFIGGAILGQAGRTTLFRVSAAWGGSQRHKELINRALNATDPIAPLLKNEAAIYYRLLGRGRSIQPGGEGI